MNRKPVPAGHSSGGAERSAKLYSVGGNGMKDNDNLYAALLCR